MMSTSVFIISNISEHEDLVNILTTFIYFYRRTYFFKWPFVAIDAMSEQLDVYSRHVVEVSQTLCISKCDTTNSIR